MPLRIGSVILTVLLSASCSTTEPEDRSAKTDTRSTATAVQQGEPERAAQHLTRTWVATGITFNGIADPNFDPARRVELLMREDGTYTMSGSGNAVEGTWRQEGTSELHLTDKATGSLQRFGISALDEHQLVVKLMDEMNAEVLLHYRSDQDPAVAR